MKTVLIFLVGMAVGYWIGKRRAEKGTTTPQPLLGNGREAKTQKDERKEEIMKMFAGLTEIKNDDVEKMLGVSDATATNYLSELEKEGKIEQVGVTGRFVTYRKK